MRWLLIDGFNLVFRSHFAMERSNLRRQSDQFPTGALHGWMKSLLDLRDGEKPDRCAVFFDLGGSDRHLAVLPEYKAQRDDTPDEWKRSFLWERVGSEAVVDFLTGYSTPARAFRANSAVILDFVKKMNQVGELTSWTVALLAEGHGRRPYKFPCGLDLETLPSRGDRGVEGTYSIGVLTDPSDEAIDMGRTEWARALEMTLAEWRPDAARNRVTPPKRPSGLKIRDVRGFGCQGVAPAPERGVLLIYPLAPEGAGTDVLEYWKDPIIAFAISFPSSVTGVKVEYRVDHLLWETEYGPAD